MSDNARFHNKLHRKNHHTLATDGYPDSATDPIASQAEPFNGDFYLAGNLNVYGSINTSYVSLSNINIPVPFLSANVGFKPTNSLIVQLSGVKYAIPVTFVGNNTFNSSSSGINSLSAGTTYLGDTYIYGTLSGADSIVWNNTTSTLLSNSASWIGGQIAFTALTANSGSWSSVYTSVCAGSAGWQSATYSDTWVRANSATVNNDYNTSLYTKLSTQAFTFLVSTSSITTLPNLFNNSSYGNFVSILGGINNTASSYAYYSLIAGGSANYTNGIFTSIINGIANTATGPASFIGGGGNNYTLGKCSGIIGGASNTATGSASFIGGGTGNSNLGDYSGIIGGQNNCIGVASSCSFILGTGISASLPNTAYVNNLNSQCLVVTSSACSNFLDVRALSATGSTLSNTRAQFFSNTNSYSQVNHQNINAGACASSDFIATANNGNDTCNYVDLGINSSNYNVLACGITGPNDAYLYTQGCNLAVGTASNYGDLILHTGGTLATNERMRITASGYVGIGTVNPISPVTISSALTALSSAPTLTIVGSISATGCVYSSNYTYIPLVYTSVNTAIRPTSGANVASGSYSIVAGGNYNGATANAQYSVIGGGSNNVISGSAAFIGGGYINTVTSQYSVIGGGACNTAQGIGASVQSGVGNTASSNYAIVVGGSNNVSSGYFSKIGSGVNNLASGCFSNIVGGKSNAATNSFSVIGGGCGNTNSGMYSIIVGGYNNTNQGVNSFIAGGNNNTIGSTITGAFILGSNITALASNRTYVNGLVAGTDICASRVIVSDSICSNPNSTAYIGTLSADSGMFYIASTCDFTIYRNNIIGGDLNVTGTARLSGNKYSTVIGNGTLSSFNINHNLGTSDVVMTVTNVSANQVVYPSIVITDSSNIIKLLISTTFNKL